MSLNSTKFQETTFLSIATPTFRFFASLRLAIAILFLLMSSLAAGTLIESFHGTDAARLVVYQSGWFTLILLFLGVNLAASAIDRLPWKRKHVGFVLTHAGIILILIGSFITQKLMIDGQVAIAEGETEHRIALNDPVLYGVSHASGRDWAAPVKKHPFAWQGSEAMAAGLLPFQARVASYYPKALLKEEIQPAESGPAAVKIRLQNSFVNQTQWLVEKDSELGAVAMGPAQLRFTDELLADTPPPTSGVETVEYLEFQRGEKKIPIPLDPAAKLPYKTSLPGTSYKIEITRLLKNAIVEGKELKDQKPAKSPTENNPAAELIVTGNGISEKHTVFAKFPDFPTLHGMKPSALGIKIYYRMANSGSRGESHELRFVKTPQGLKYQIQKGASVKTGEVKTGEPVETGWMGLNFFVEEYFPHAQFHREFEPTAENSQNPQAVSAIQLELRKSGEQKTLWLGEGSQESVTLDGETYQLALGQKQIPMGFRLMLKDFRVEQYPGTERPASFESDVVLKDDAHGVARDVTISMNHPLIYRGYRIYQSGYSLPSTQPGGSSQEVSVFSVGRDPGAPINYLGAIVMISGIILMFYTRKFSSRPESK